MYAQDIRMSCKVTSVCTIETHSNTVLHCAKKRHYYQVTTVLATSKNVLFPGHNCLLTTSTDDPTL